MPAYLIVMAIGGLVGLWILSVASLYTKEISLAFKAVKEAWFEFTPLLPESWTSEDQKKRWAFAYLYALYVRHVGRREFRLHGSETVWRVLEPRVSLSPGREKLVFEWLKRGDPACIHLRDMWKGRDPGGHMGDVIHSLNEKFASTYTKEDMYAV